MLLICIDQIISIEDFPSLDHLRDPLFARDFAEFNGKEQEKKISLIDTKDRRVIFPLGPCKIG